MPRNPASGPRPGAAASIYRDRHGTPYAVGKTDAAAFHAFGHAQAQDHALELPFLGLQVEGRLAEVFGPDCLKSDLRARTLGFARDAKGVVARLPAEIRDDVLRPFADGINAGLAARSSLPAWVERTGLFDAERIAAIALFYGFALATANDPHGYGAFVAEAPWRSNGLPTLVPSMGSNAFALAGSRTRSGAAIVGAVPHLALRHPFLMIEAGLKGHRIDAHGFTFLGLPLPIFGFTKGVAWGVTIDTVDAYDRTHEAVRDGAAPSVLRHDGWRPLTHRDEAIKVLGWADVQATLREGDRGPIVLDIAPGRAIALDWAGRGEGTLLEQLHAMATASDLAEFEGALALLGTPNYAFTAADIRGRLLFAHLGHAPERATTFVAPGGPTPCKEWAVDVVLDQATPVLPCLAETLPGIPGWAKGGERAVLHRHDALPVERDPISGWTQAANTPPAAHTKSARLIECPGESIAPCRDTPSYKQNDRGRRQSSRLDAMNGATLDDAQDLLMDAYLAAADRLLPALFDAWNKSSSAMAPGERSRLAPAVAALGAWDRKAARTSTASALFHAYAVTVGIDDKTDEGTRMAALGAAVDHLERHFGRVDPPWSDAHLLKRETSALRAGSAIEIGVGGGLQALGALHALDGGVPLHLGSLAGRDLRRNPRHDGRERSVFGTAAIMIVELDRAGPRARTALIFGASDDPASRHFADQARDLIRHDALKDVPFALADIEKAATSRLDLGP